MKEHKFKINGNEYNVAVNSISGNVADVTVNGTSYQVEMDNAPAVPVQYAQPAAPVQATSPSAPAPSAPAAAPKGEGKAVTSPLPGVIIDIKVNVGDTVKAGQEVAVLEAMKMDNDITAPCDGVVSFQVAKGANVESDSVLAVIG